MIKLDKKDNLLLYELDCNSRQSDVKLAKKVGLARNSISYRIRRLKKAGVIKNFVTLINPLKFNKSIFKLYLRVDRLDELLKKYLCSQKEVFWLTKCEGSWDYVVAVWAYSSFDFYEFLQKLSNKFGSQIVDREVSTQIEVPFFNRAYLIQGRGSLKCVWGGKPTKSFLDDVDLKILKELATNSRMNSVELAQKLGLTSRIVRYRIRSLEKQKIIISYSIQIGVNKFGFDYYKTIIKFKSNNHSEEEKLIEYCKQQKNILYYIKTLGAWDLELEWEIKEYKELIKQMDQLRLEFSSLIGGVEHLLITEEFKGEYNTIQ